MKRLLRKKKINGEISEEDSWHNKDLSDEDYIKMIDEKVKATEFVNAIVIYVG